jgi:hypothetical protein
MRYAATLQASEREDGQRFRWSRLVWWACQDLNLRLHPDRKMTTCGQMAASPGR